MQIQQQRTGYSNEDEYFHKMNKQLIAANKTAHKKGSLTTTTEKPQSELSNTPYLEPTWQKIWQFLTFKTRA